MPRALRAAVPLRHDQAERQRVVEQVQQARYGRDHLLLPVDQIVPNPDNPRQSFSEDALNQLAASIQRWGQLQPVVVRRVGDRYQLICGERRWRAHTRAGLDTIWAVERDATDQDALALALVENLQRVDLSHAEKVAALDQLAEVARAQGLRKTALQLHVDAGWLSRQLSVRKDPVVFPALESGRLGFGQATELLRAPAHTRRSLLDQALRAKKRVPTATLRAWVEDERALERQSRVGVAERMASPPAPAGVDGPARSPFRALLEQLVTLGRPASADDRGALQEMIARAQWLLEAPEARADSPAPTTAGAA
jgi:ParB-like chromosome segregation protein Spo0J